MHLFTYNMQIFAHTTHTHTYRPLPHPTRVLRITSIHSRLRCIRRCCARSTTSFPVSEIFCRTSTSTSAHRLLPLSLFLIVTVVNFPHERQRCPSLTRGSFDLAEVMVQLISLMSYTVHLSISTSFARHDGCRSGQCR